MFAVRAYRLFIAAYPRAYRNVFAAEMAAVFEEAAKDWKRRGELGYSGFLLREIGGLMSGLLSEWRTKLLRRADYGEAFCDAREAADSLPGEVAEARQRVNELVAEMVHAIAHHDFERARTCSRRENEERERYRLVCEKHNVQL